MLSRAALAKELLLYRMCQLSEDVFSAGWLTGLDFEVRETAYGNPPMLAGMEVTESVSKTFRDLAVLAGGWWVWGRTDDGEIIMGLAEWKECLAQRSGNGR